MIVAGRKVTELNQVSELASDTLFVITQEGSVRRVSLPAIVTSLIDLGVSGVKRDLAIPASGWTSGAEESPDGEMYIDIPQEDVTEEMVPIVSILPKYADIAKAARMSPTCRTMQGKVRLYAEAEPKSEIAAVLTLLIASNGTAGGGGSSGGGGSTYVLPTATATRLGGVKIGDKVNVDVEGKISVSSEAILDEMTATDDEVNEMLNTVFG